MSKVWVEYSKRGFSNEIMIQCFDNKNDAEMFVSDHEHYAKIVSKNEALKNNSFGYYIQDGERIDC